jgi:acid phosphatase type 7
MFSKFRVIVFIVVLLGSLLSLPGRDLSDRRSDAALAASDPVIAAAGDISCDPGSPSFNGGNGSATACRQKYTSDLLFNAGLAAVLPLGDVQYYCGGYQAFLQSYDLSWGRVKDITRPVVGNHEYLTSGGTDCNPANQGAAGYFNYFGAAAGNPGQGYYSYDIGDWHLIALNSNCTDAGGCSPVSPQGKWLAADLAANSKWCTLAYWHIPLFSSGGRAEQNSRELWKMLYDKDVDVVLNGHDHIYERFAPQTPDGIADPLRGIRQFTVGTGGGNHTSLATIAANSEERNTDTFGVLKLTLRLTGYDWEFVPEAGGTYTDEGSQECHGSGPPPVPTTPVPVFTPTAVPPPTGADVNLKIGESTQEHQWVFNGQSRMMSYPNVNDGPVQLTSTNNVSLFGSERTIYQFNNVPVSFSEMMALPDSQLNTTYWLPWYNNKDLDTQLRFGNVSSSTATVRVYIGGREVRESPFTLAPGASTRQSFAGVNDGPVKIVSNVKIVAAQRIIYKVNNVPTSFSEMMALPNSLTNTTHWLPWYNNVSLNTQLRLANVSSSAVTVRIYIGGQEMPGSPFNLPRGQSIRKSFPGIDGGPVKIVSTGKIVAAERVIYKVNGVDTSFTELMALSNSQVGRTYWLPWYNNVGLDTQLRIANLSTSTATVRVYIGGREMPGSPFNLPRGQSIRQSFTGVNAGPVKIVSTQDIVAAQRIIYKVNNMPTSFSEMLALPSGQLSTSYWLPWYNSVDLDTQLRFGVP